MQDIKGLGYGIFSSLGNVGQAASGLMSAYARQGEFSEQLRRLRQEKASTLGLANAKTGASGVEMTSASSVQYLNDLSAEFDRAIAATKRNSTLSLVSGIIGVGAGLVGGGASTYKTLADINNWWA